MIRDGNFGAMLHDVGDDQSGFDELIIQWRPIDVHSQSISILVSFDHAPMVYFARLSSGNIKIGWTGNLLSRVRSLGTDYYDDREVICILGVHHGGFEIEKYVHRKFEHLRISSHREEFRPGSDLMEYIDGCCCTHGFDDIVTKANLVLLRLYIVGNWSVEEVKALAVLSKGNRELLEISVDEHVMRGCKAFCRACDMAQTEEEYRELAQCLDNIAKEINTAKDRLTQKVVGPGMVQGEDEYDRA
jgi:hypothetical protein